MTQESASSTSAQKSVVGSVKRIPLGKVSTYGAIADEHGLSARQVAQILATNDDNIPWHRVIKSDGTVPKHAATRKQQQLLESEGLSIKNGRIVAFQDHFFAT